MEPINWQERWKQAIALSSKHQKRAKHGVVEFWNNRADWFQRNTKGDVSEAKLVTETVSLNKGMRVLDIGAGTGRFTIPLAKKVSHVTAIEPSPEMAKFLEINAREQGVTNYTIINKKWDEIKLGVDIEPHDVAVAAYSLMFDDMWDAVSKINKSASEYAFIFTWVKRTFWDFDVLWPKIHGEPFFPGPDYIYIVNMLYEMGAHSNVKVFFKEKTKKFKNIEEILQDLKDNIYYDCKDKDDELIKYINSMTYQENGQVFHPGKSERIMLFWTK